jgi:hypothetical protein
VATTDEFVNEFVLPLLQGGSLRIHRAYSLRDRAAMLADAGALGGAELRFVRLRRAQELVAAPELPEPDADELSLWLGLSNVLFLDHPDTGRVWARTARWQQVEEQTRTLLECGAPVGMHDAHVRHVSVGAFLGLRREDRVIATTSGERRFVGQPIRAGLFGSVRGEAREEHVEWIRQAHAPGVERLLPSALGVSPLTSLLAPRFAPPGWSPLAAAGFLRARPWARAVVHRWALAPDWVRTGAVLAGSLLQALGLPSAVFGLPGSIRLEDPDAPEAPAPDLPDPVDVGAVVGALVHLHVLKVLELSARIGVSVGTGDWAVQTFLALPLLLRWLEPTLGSPFDPLRGGDLARRWEEYVEHLRGMVPRGVVENLVAMLVPRIVQRASA